MSAKLYSHIQGTTTENLLVLLEFFDHPNVRRYYTGLIADILEELANRGSLVQDASK